MAKKNAHKGHHVSHAHHKKHSRNPLARQITMGRPSDIAKAGAGVLVGVAVAKGVVAMLPANITASNLYSFLAAVGIAIGEWWAFSMIDPEFGAAAGLGGIAEAGSIGLNAWLPSVGQRVSLGQYIPAVNANQAIATVMPNTGISGLGGKAYGRAYRMVG